MTASGAKPNGQRGGGKPPVDSKTRAKVRRLAREGLSRNAIARETGISTASVSKICATARPPISFDRSKTRAAVEAVGVDLKARRAAISIGLLDDLDKLRKMMFEPMERHHVSVTNGDFVYNTPASPAEIQALFVSAGIAIDKHLVLVRHDADPADLPAVDQWLAAKLPDGPAPF